ncbi:general secretion pathway protein J [Litorimonas taeanensis]|uniref:Type II secretion system protein J n=1 Tax=Litorimonas taeanensis TaxID=568099 RepID=A0A420WDV6_9PROT|nr:type II secretion system minor pseudopilin GspJ [Litorimonas taeanensis]RKQ69214.1 general secretion pathway protein J [Litorimonas taeanensis]
MRAIRYNQAGHNQAGFTLIEMLVSLFVFSLVSVGTMTAMGSSLSMRDRVNQGMDALTQIQASRAIIRADFERLSARKRRDILGSFEPYVLTTDTDALISFTRLGRENPGGLEPRGDAERVEYIFEDNKLIRQSWSSANPNVTAEPRETVLFENLETVEVEFLASDLIPITRLAIPVDNTAPIPGVIRFRLTDDKNATTDHIFELRL